jgi:putative transposase
MTRYAVSFNKRHHRTGHLFQNRYKSVVCEEEPYFLELVRYIHLNPLRAGIVTSLSALDTYPWCGHSAIMGRTTRAWQDRIPVLMHFSKSVAEAVLLYHAFVDEGKERGKQPELTGGGLTRSVGGAPLRKENRVAYDARILGSGDFVTRVLNEMERRPDRQPVDKDGVIARICEEFGIHQEQLRNGSRRKAVTEARVRIIEKLVNESGVSLTEVAGLIGISPSGVGNVLKRVRADR